MKKSTLLKFRKLFSDQRDHVLRRGLLRDGLAIELEHTPDEVDQATTDIEESMRLRLRNRDLLSLKMINEALRRIDDGCFGECESCSSEIELRRIEARPTATLCVSCQEEEEKREQLNRNLRRPDIISHSPETF